MRLGSLDRLEIKFERPVVATPDAVGRPGQSHPVGLKPMTELRLGKGLPPLQAIHEGEEALTTLVVEAMGRHGNHGSEQ